MSAERVIGSHLRIAAEALTAARALLEIGNRFAVYQAEQAVEQILLALALSEGLHVARSQHHQLDTMHRALPEKNAFRSDVAELTWLEAFATTFRYPKQLGSVVDPPAVERLSAALAASEVLLSGVAKHFQVDLDMKSRTPASHAKPPRRP